MRHCNSASAEKRTRDFPKPIFVGSLSGVSILRLDQASLEIACRELARIEPGFALVLERFGFPPLWEREPSFATLVHIILEQQVSLASALAAFKKLVGRIGAITPRNILSLSDEELRQCYLSRQKSGYVRALAAAVLDGHLDFDALAELPDHDARLELKKVKGIGDWTADIFLLMALCRPDVMPKGDLALHIAYRNLAAADHTAHADEFQRIAERWKPHRASAARILWHFYLSDRKHGPRRGSER